MKQSRIDSYRGMILRRAAELSKQYDGLRKIPGELLVENGFGVISKGRRGATISIPIPKDIDSLVIETSHQERKRIEIDQFKLPPEPTPTALKSDSATMEDFWIEQGWYKIDRNGWRLTFAKWTDAGPEVMRKATRHMILNVLGKDPREVTAQDFRSNKLKGLMTGQYENSPYAAITDAFPEQDIKPWEMLDAPQGIYKKRENRVAAIRWAVQKCEKDPRDMNQEDLNLVRGALPYYNGSPYEAINDAYPEMEIKPWEMATTPNGYFKIRKNRIAAIKWLARKLKKDQRDIEYDDFLNNRLGRIMKYYQDSPYKAVVDAFPDTKAWEMIKTPKRFFDNPVHRIAAVKWLVDKLGIEPRQITGQHFISNRLHGLLCDHYGSSPFEALFEAGLATREDEVHMRKSGPR